MVGVDVVCALASGGCACLVGIGDGLDNPTHVAPVFAFAYRADAGLVVDELY